MGSAALAFGPDRSGPLSEGSHEPFDVALFRKNLGNRFWRLNNLYKVRDENGRVVTFRMKKEQQLFYYGMHHRNNILKARQIGFTTEQCIIQLDAAIFENAPCALIADRLSTAHRIFREKILFPYLQLPEVIRQINPAVNKSAGELVFANGGSVYLDVSFRGGTVLYLHVSELGKICARTPEKAREIITGAYPAVHQDGVITNESTAEGQGGYFHDISITSLNARRARRPLTPLDFKFFFFPWWTDPKYQTKAAEAGYQLPQRMVEYFHELSAKYKINLTPEQKLWYAKTEALLGFDMFREYPSYPEEAFKLTIVGAYYASEFRRVWTENRITSVPHDPAVSVHTIWDIGLNDTNSIWFVQRVGREWHIIDYYANSGYGLQHYITELENRRNELGYRYGVHIGPHDLKVREWGNDGKTRLQTALELGIRFELAPDVGLENGIQAVRNVLALCWFDEGRTDEGLSGLQAYRREWDEKVGTWKNKPLHDKNSHPADSFRYFAVSLDKLIEGFSSVPSAPAQAGGGNFAYA